MIVSFDLYPRVQSSDDKSILRLFFLLTCSVCVLMMGSECWWSLGDGSNFVVLGHFQVEGAV